MTQVWQSLRVEGELQPRGDDTTGLHVWDVYARGASGRRGDLLGRVSMIRGATSWTGPRLQALRPDGTAAGDPPAPWRPEGWTEILRGALEAAADLSDWSVPVEVHRRATEPEPDAPTDADPDAAGDAGPAPDEPQDVARAPDPPSEGHGAAPAAKTVAADTTLLDLPSAALRRLGMTLTRKDGATETWCWDPGEPRCVYDAPHREAALGLAFSGGGVRAAAYGLGALWALFDLGLDTAVRVTTSVSGGSVLAGAWLAARHHGQAPAAFFARMLGFLQDTAPSRARPRGPAELIDRYADVLDADLFSAPDAAGPGPTLGQVHDDAIEAVFQITEMTRAQGFSLGLHRRGEARGRGAQWGSPGAFVLPPALAAPIRLADAVAASAAFPVGFAPLVFPENFVLHDDAKEAIRQQLDRARAAGRWPQDRPWCWQTARRDVPLSDGGIHDNQGIDALIRATGRRGGRLHHLLVVDADGTDITQAVIRPRRATARPVELALLALLVAVAGWGWRWTTHRIGGPGPLLGGAAALGIAAAYLGAGWATRAVLPPSLGAVRLLLPWRFFAALVIRAELAVRLLLQAFMQRVRRMAYDRLYDQGLARHIAVAQARIRGVELHVADADDDTREAAFRARYPASAAAAAISRDAAKLGTGLRFGLRASTRIERTRRAVQAGRANTLLALLRVGTTVPRPRTPAARALLERIEQLWDAEWGPGGKAPDPATWAGPRAGGPAPAQQPSPDPTVGSRSSQSTFVGA